MYYDRPQDAAKALLSLQGEKTRREAQWRKLSRWICPYRGRFEETFPDYWEGEEPERFTHVASQAALLAASGMTSGMTPRNISWFKPTFKDSSLTEASGARQWLDILDAAMKDCLAEGGFYQAIQNFNLDLIWAGCGLLYCDGGRENVLDFTCQQPGTYYLQTDSTGRLEVVCRRLSYSLEEAASVFGEENLSENSRRKLEKNPLQTISVWHLAKPLPRDRQREGDFTVQSLYWEDGRKDTFLRKSGYFEMPFFFARWNDGATCYGTGPGDFCLADAIQIDTLERRKLAGLGKLVDPPVCAPQNYKDVLDLTPGGINYLAQRDVITPILDLSPYAQAMTGIMNEIAVVTNRLEKGLMATIFASMPLDQRPAGMSATEFLERKRETLQQLGPIISAYEPQVLSPLLLRTALALNRAGLIPEAPQSLAGIPLFMKMDFISPVANALRQTGAETTRALFQDIALMFQATQNQEIFDKVDLDQMVDELAQGIGAPGSIIRADDDVAKIRQQRAQAIQQMQQIQAIQQAGEESV